MAEHTTNYNLAKQQLNEYVSIEGLNSNFDKIDTILGNTGKFEKAGGTATVITLTGVILEDGVCKTFIVKENNEEAAITINGKNLYKPGTTNAPNLIVGKAVTVWYDSTGDCFFIKASAEGSAVAGNVLAGKTFSNDYDTGIEGTMLDLSDKTTNIAWHNHPYVVEVDANDARMGVVTIPNQMAGKGYIDETTKLRAQLYDLIPSNIKYGARVGQYSGYGSGYMTGEFTGDATAVAGDMIEGKTAYVKGAKVTGNIPIGGNDEYAGWVRGNVGMAPNNGRAHFQIPTNKYYNSTVNNGQQGVFVDDPEFTPANILNTANIFGMQGTAIAGKRWATGTVYAVSDVQYAWQGLTGGTNIGNMNAASIPISNMGLSFIPRLILLINQWYTPAQNGGYGVSIFFRDGFADGWPCHFINPVRHKVAPYDYMPGNGSVNGSGYTFIAYE